MEYEKLVGRKLTFRERLQFRIDKNEQISDIIEKIACEERLASYETSVIKDEKLIGRKLTALERLLKMGGFGEYKKLIKRLMTEQEEPPGI